MSETFDLGTTRLRLLLAHAAATVLEGELDPGGGSSWHTHRREDETLVVLEGTVVVDEGDRHELCPGAAYVLPRGVRQAFANESGSLARLYFFWSAKSRGASLVDPPRPHRRATVRRNSLARLACGCPYGFAWQPTP